MKINNSKIYSILLQIFCGATIAFLTSLLIYFKQKEFLHIGIVLLLVSALYYGGHNVILKVKSSVFIQIAAFIFLLLFGMLAPNFIYLVRPYTFYISGIAIGVIAVIMIAMHIVDEHESINLPWKYVTFLISFFTSYLVPWHILQYLIIGLIMLITILFVLRLKIVHRLTLTFSFIAISSLYYFYSTPLVSFPEQEYYEDKVLFSANTQFHRMVITQWQKNQWIFIDKLKNISSIDEYLFYEPMAHSVFRIGEDINNILIIGGENGCLIREVLKYKTVNNIDVISYDTLMRNISLSSSYFKQMNQHAYEDTKVQILKGDLIEYVSKTDQKFQAIFVDLPDPRTVEANQYYTYEFYSLLKKILTPNGLMITQAGSPYFASKAFLSIGNTIEESGFYTLPLHNQILTLGEWGWFVASTTLEPQEIKELLIANENPEIETKWFNTEAAKLISAFGKEHTDTNNLGINTLENPLVYQYYLKGNWELN